MPAGQTKARFFEPMLLQRADSLPKGANWAYEVKLDGYRALAIRTSGKVHLRSRHNKDFNIKYPAIVSALATLPDETLIDGVVVAGRNVMSEPASVRRDLLRREILPKLGEPIRESPVIGANLPDLINAVRAH